MRKKKGTKAQGDSDSQSSGEDSAVLIDENEMAEIKKAKAQEKAQKKADRAMARIDKYNKITTGEAKAPVKAKRAPAAKGKRG